MNLPIVHHPAYCADLPANHRFPMDKFRALADLIRTQGLLGGGDFVRPRPAPFEWVALAHDPSYVDQVFNTQVPDRIAREIGFPMREDIALRARCATGGSVLTGYLALEHGLACNTAGGSHHARRAHGAGFCVFNDVAVAIKVMQADGAIRKALVIDLDVHQGDGTADIFSGDPDVFTFSMHSQKNYPVRKVPSHQDIGLPDGVGDEAYLEKLAQVLPGLLARDAWDIVFYNAGVDPYAGDRLGRLSLSREGLLRRELMVIGSVREAGIPLAGVLGGGYSTDIDELADRHATLHRAALSVCCDAKGRQLEASTGLLAGNKT
ncbi:histone deacetylase [Roseibium denhamense]|uniref:Acetoin utilization deacetylase AcuC n=1 Tax=Roseibium denhamense TaxID=76305 RepID=A0ABY1P4D1_9HYPH|nr:histone deacetylase [Roseibium denhamense]MTI07250.1 histone deacetylase [Roseibium denhamense]SMP26259.1 Acetoin utilization deacetylase AcuC [Roseibium denhamense]